jgi:hypothetical protein
MAVVRSTLVLSMVACLAWAAGCAAPVESGAPADSEVATTEDAIRSEKALKAAISRTIEGVFTFSESDDDFQYVEAPLATGERISDRAVRAKFADVIKESLDEGENQTIDQLGVTIVDFDKWFGDPADDATLTEPDQVAQQKKMRTLQRLMKENLTQLKVYEYGQDTTCDGCSSDRIRVTILVVGKSKLSNKIVGVRTFATET